MGQGIYDAEALAIAAGVGFVGIVLSLRFFTRLRTEPPGRRGWWIVLAGMTSGLTLWATNLLIVMGFSDAADGVHGYDPVRVGAALVISVALSALLIRFAASGGAGRWRRRLSTGCLGLLLAGLHLMAIRSLEAQGALALQPGWVAALVAWGTLASAALGGWLERDSPRALRLAVAGMAAVNMVGFVTLAARTAVFLPDPDMPPPSGVVGPDSLLLAIVALTAALGVGGWAVTTIDTSLRREAEDGYRHLALHDPLTGLPNRAYLRLELARLLGEDGVAEGGAAAAGPAGEGVAEGGGEDRGAEPGPAEPAAAERSVAVVGVDLDRFKPINDVHGHAAGDAVLAGVAERVRALLGPGELFARTGGDEFVAVKHPCGRHEAQRFAARLAEAVRSPMDWEGSELSVGASLGIAVHPSDAADVATLLGRVDLALYRAKRIGGGAVRCYDRRMDEARRSRFALAMELRQALQRDEFELRYQAQTDLATGRPLAFEALIRWIHPERGLIQPDDFIPVAEETGLIRDIGAWVLHAACRAAARWEGDYRIAVNVSPLQIAQPDFAELVRDALMGGGLDPARLELEVTEASLIADHAGLRSVMNELKAMGVRIAMDDYGTGYASLATLRGFPFDKIKIDRSFIDSLDVDPQSAGIVQSTLLLGRALDIPVLAEGVETEPHKRFLLAEGCAEGQGYLFGRPMTEAELRALIARDKARALAARPSEAGRAGAGGAEAGGSRA